MTDGIFKENDCFAYARATEIMSTKSETDFEWSVKLIGHSFFVGIASQLKREDSYVCNYDENAILYCSDNHSSVISILEINTKYKKTFNQKRTKRIHKNLPKQKTGDVIKFRFEPQRKKLVIDLVRIL